MTSTGVLISYREAENIRRQKYKKMLEKYRKIVENKGLVRKYVGKLLGECQKYMPGQVPKIHEKAALLYISGFLVQ